jgi:hypothetical protein
LGAASASGASVHFGVVLALYTAMSFSRIARSL